LREQAKGVQPYVSFGVELRRLLDALHAGNLRENFAKQVGCFKQFKGAAGVALGQHLRQLIANPLPAHSINARRQASNRGLGPRL